MNKIKYSAKNTLNGYLTDFKLKSKIRKNN